MTTEHMPHLQDNHQPSTADRLTRYSSVSTAVIGRKTAADFSPHQWQLDYHFAIHRPRSRCAGGHHGAVRPVLVQAPTVGRLIRRLGADSAAHIDAAVSPVKAR